MLTDTEVAEPIQDSQAGKIDKELAEALEEWEQNHERNRQASMQTAEVCKRLGSAGICVQQTVKYGYVTVRKADLTRVRAVLGCPLKLKERTASYMNEGMVSVHLTPLAYPQATIKYEYRPSETDRCQLQVVHYRDTKLVCKT